MAVRQEQTRKKSCGHGLLRAVTLIVTIFRRRLRSNYCEQHSTVDAARSAVSTVFLPPEAVFAAKNAGKACKNC